MPSRMPFITPDGKKLLLCKCDGKVSFDLPAPGRLPNVQFRACPWRIHVRDLASGQESRLPTGMADPVIETRPTAYQQDGLWNVLFIARRNGADGFLPNLFKVTTADWTSFSEPKRVLAKYTSKGFVNGQYLLCDDGTRQVFLIRKDSGERVTISLTFDSLESVSYMPSDEGKIIMSGRSAGKARAVMVDVAAGSATEVTDSGSSVRDFSMLGDLFFCAAGTRDEDMEVKQGTAKMASPTVSISVKRG